MSKLKTIIKDVKNQTSHSVDFLLKNDIESTLSKKGIKIRKLVAPILRAVYRTQTDYKIVKDSEYKLKNNNIGKIFVLNHRQADDIVIGANAVGKSATIVFGNKYLALETINGLGLWGYGMILLDRDNEESRKSTYKKMKYIIQNGGNIIIYPEGYWNLADDGKSDERHKADDHKSENWLIQDINIGVLRLAQETGCEIVPTILHYDETDKKTCYTKRGNIFTLNKEDNIFQKKEELLEIMYSMYFELMEKYSSYTRSELEKTSTLKEQWEQLKKELISACDIDSINYKLDLKDEKLIGKAKVVKNITTTEEAFEFRKKYNI